LVAVGAAGTVQRREGDVWTGEIIGDGTTQLSDVWGSSASDVYAVGDSTIWHFDGSGWTDVATVPNSLDAVWGSGPTDVWAVGNGNLVHYDGADWTGVTDVGGLAIINGVQLNDVWGTGPDDVFVVGATGSPIGETPVPLIFHKSASGWAQMPVPPIDAYLLSVSGTAPNDVYAVGHDLNGYSFTPIMLHCDDNGWSTIEPPPSNGLVNVWANASGLFVVGREGFNAPVFQTWRRDGAGWTVVPLPTELDGPATFPNSTPAIGGTSDTDLYLVGPRGHLARYDGASWARMQGEAGARLTMRAALGVGNDGAFAAGSGFWQGARWGVLLRQNAGVWTEEAVPEADAYTGLWAASPTDVFASGIEVGVLRWNGSSWTEMPPPPGSYGDRYSVWGSSANDVWSAGDGPVWRFSGAAWTEAGFNVSTATGIWGSGPSDVYFVTGGQNSTIVGYHYAGSGITPIVDPIFQTFDAAYDVWGSSATDVYLVGASDNNYAAVWHYDGMAWTDVTPDTTVNAYEFWSISGRSADDIYVCGRLGRILHRDATGWSPMISGTNRDLLGVWVGADGRAYAAGDRGSILTRAP
jgi:hypothetical protein